MAGSVTFILKNPDQKAKEKTLVYLVFWYRDLRIKLSTGEKILPRYWNPGAHRSRQTERFPENENFNTRLDNLQRNVEATVRDHLNEHNIIIPIWLSY
jgi:hypothetical protein